MGFRMSAGDSAMVRDLTPQDVAQGLAEGRILLVDVREDRERAIERIADSVSVPVSAFDPAAIPDPRGRQVVFFCGSGGRSRRASQMAQERGLAYDAHLAGGLKAWKAAGLPTENDIAKGS